MVKPKVKDPTQIDAIYKGCPKCQAKFVMESTFEVPPAHSNRVTVNVPKGNNNNMRAFTTVARCLLMVSC